MATILGIGIVRYLEINKNSLNFFFLDFNLDNLIHLVSVQLKFMENKRFNHKNNYAHKKNNF